MIRQPFLKLLEQYRKTAPQEECGVIEELKKHVMERADCFERRIEEDAKHIAASVFVVTPDYGKSLFLWHKKIREWTHPGGHADGNPDIHAVALQELKEETGLTQVTLASTVPLDIFRYDYGPSVFGYRKSIYNICFIAILPKDQEPKVMEPEKCGSMRWATPRESYEIMRNSAYKKSERIIKKWEIFVKSKNKKWE